MTVLEKVLEPAVTAASSVAAEMAALIINEMRPGSSLPSEADLAERFGVSRLTVREAVKMLAGRGLVDLARGRRAIVREPDGSVFGDFLSSVIQYDPKGLFDLIEVRMSLEVQAASLAAKRASRPALAGMESAIVAMRAVIEDLRDGGEPVRLEARFHEADLGFHGAVTLASANRVLLYLFEAMAAPLRDAFYISRRGHELRGHTLEDTVAAHQRILDCISRGDERGAGDAMRAHLRDTERDIRAAVSTLAGSTAPRR